MNEFVFGKKNVTCDLLIRNDVTYQWRIKTPGQDSFCCFTVFIYHSQTAMSLEQLNIFSSPAKTSP